MPCDGAQERRMKRLPRGRFRGALGPCDCIRRRRLGGGWGAGLVRCEHMISGWV